MQNLTENDLRQFTGDLVRYRHSLNRKVIYTPGVQHVAESAGAYWLIDAIATHIGSKPFNEAVATDERVGEWHVWALECSWSKAAQLSARVDSPEEPCIVQNFLFTDFPLPRIDIWAGFDGEHWTLYLPSEQRTNKERVVR